MKLQKQLLAAADLYNLCRPANVPPIVPTHIKMKVKELESEEIALRQIVGKVWDGLAYGNW